MARVDPAGFRTGPDSPRDLGNLAAGQGTTLHGPPAVCPST